MRIATAIAVSMFLFGATANAATLYVATTGNDAAAGTVDAPFRTISKAAGMARPGDSVTVRGGTYFENVRIDSKGTAAARIVFRFAKAAVCPSLRPLSQSISPATSRTSGGGATSSSAIPTRCFTQAK